MSAPTVEICDVSVRFGTCQALEDIQLETPAGAFVAIIGPNGAGKSTLLNVLLGLQTPQRGTVRIDGAPPRAFPSARLGYVPQLKTLDRSFPATALELVATGLYGRWPWRVSAKDRERVIAAMTQTGVADTAERGISKLSGGELQRVFLARCLVRRPSLLVLDEPAAGMDVVGEADMYHLLENYQRASGATIFMITHDWEGARVHASHVLLLNRRVIAFGPAEEAAREELLLDTFGHAGHVQATHRGTPDA